MSRKRGKFKLHIGGAEKMEAVMEKEGVTTMHSASVSSIEVRDELLDNLKKSGQKLNSLLNVRPRHIHKAIKEARKEWK